MTIKLWEIQETNIERNWLILSIDMYDYFQKIVNPVQTGSEVLLKYMTIFWMNVHPVNKQEEHWHLFLAIVKKGLLLFNFTYFLFLWSRSYIIII